MVWPCNAATYGGHDSATFLGWIGTKAIAIERSIGYFDLDKRWLDWHINYIILRDR
jgi:hypothetical protein